MINDYIKHTRQNVLDHNSRNFLKVNPKHQCCYINILYRLSSCSMSRITCIWDDLSPFVYKETPKRVLLQIVKTQMKCRIMRHFNRVYTVCKGKKRPLDKKKIHFLSYNLTPPDMYNGLSQVIVSNQEEESNSIQRVN